MSARGQDSEYTEGNTVWLTDKSFYFPGHLFLPLQAKSPGGDFQQTIFLLFTQQQQQLVKEQNNTGKWDSL